MDSRQQEVQLAAIVAVVVVTLIVAVAMASTHKPDGGTVQLKTQLEALMTRVELLECQASKDNSPQPTLAK